MSIQPYWIQLVNDRGQPSVSLGTVEREMMTDDTDDDCGDPRTAGQTGDLQTVSADCNALSVLKCHMGCEVYLSTAQST